MTAASDRPVALVTGASSGIGRAAATRLAQNGFAVFGTSRGDDATPPPGVTMGRCDVTDDASVAEAVETVISRTDRIDVLVNNAGLGLAGPAEATSIDQARALFEVNVFGLIRMTQAVLPIMRAQRGGRVVNVSSVFGLMPAPYMAVYAATKHAVEGYTESLDHEVRGFGIRAIAIEPANTRTAFDANLVRAHGDVPGYEGVDARVDAMLRGMMETGDDADVVAEVILAAARAAKPRLRYAAGRGRLLSRLRRFVPAGAFDASLRKQLGV